MNSIPIVEGVIGSLSAECYRGPCVYEIFLPHNTYGFGRALANAFAPSEQVVVIRKSDLLRMEREIDDAADEVERAWLNEK